MELKEELYYLMKTQNRIKHRENMAETFETQTIGRIRRMPRARNYDYEILDFCFASLGAIFCGIN